MRFVAALIVIPALFFFEREFWALKINLKEIFTTNILRNVDGAGHELQRPEYAEAMAKKLARAIDTAAAQDTARPAAARP